MFVCDYIFSFRFMHMNSLLVTFRINKKLYLRVARRTCPEIAKDGEVWKRKEEEFAQQWDLKQIVKASMLGVLFI